MKDKLVKPNELAVVIMGASSVGKDTLLDYMTGVGYTPLVSHTTRPKRDLEIDGQHYHFVNERLFKKHQRLNNLVQVREYSTLQDGVSQTWYYGVHKNELSKDGIKVVILDRQASVDFKNETGLTLVRVQLVLDDSIRKERAQQRGNFCEHEWNRRLQDDKQRFAVDDSDVVYIQVKDMTPAEIYEYGIKPWVKLLTEGDDAQEKDGIE